MTMSATSTAANGARPSTDSGDEAAPAPTFERIKQLSTESDTSFRAFHSQCKLEEDYYFLRRPVPAPQGIDPTRPATARAIVDVATDHVDVNNITIDIPLMLRSKARAERIKKLYLGIWANIREPVLRTAVKHAFTYGIGWLQPMVKADLWFDAPKMSDYGVTLENGEVMLVREQQYKEDLQNFMERRRVTFPFVCRNVNPRELRWDDSATGPNWVIRKVQSSRGDIKRRFPNWVGMGSRPDSDPTTWIEYWDHRYYAYLADNEFVQKPTEHGYGFLPFFPVRSASTIDWDAGKPEDRYQGILYPVHQLLDSEARLVTQVEAILRKVAWVTLDIYGPRHSAQQVEDQYEVFSGKNIIPPGVEVKSSPVIQLPPDLLGHLARIQTMIEEATFPNVVRGLRPTGVSTGFGVSVLAGMGRLRFQGVADGISRAVEACNSGFARMLENVLRSSVTVHARSEVHSFDETIKPSDINGYYENIVTFKAEAPEEREREALLGLQLRREGVISLYEAQRRAGIANPLDEQNQIAAEELLKELRPEQLERLRARLGSNQQAQQQQAGGGPPNLGNQFLPGQGQLQRPGERNIQQARVSARDGQPSVFPRGNSGLDILGRQLGTAAGGTVGLPTGQSVRR